MDDALVAAGLGFAGVVSGATGLAFPLIAGPVLLMRYAPPQAIMITAMCSLLGQAFSMSLLRRAVEYEIRWRLVLPGIAGIPIGAALVMSIDTRSLRLALGAMMILSCACFFLRSAVKAPPVRSSVAGDGVAGFCGGISGALFGVASVIPAAWLCLQVTDRKRQRGIVQPYIFVMQSLSVISLYAHGLQDSVSTREFEWYVPAVLSGIFAGTLVFRWMTCEAYARAVFTLTFASGLMLMFH